MPLTQCIAILRTGQVLIAAAAVAGLISSSTAVAGAKPETLDETGYMGCVDTLTDPTYPGGPLPYNIAVERCCDGYGGVPTSINGTVPYCEAPDISPEQVSDPTKPVAVPGQVDAPAEQSPVPTKPGRVPGQVNSPDQGPTGPPLTTTNQAPSNSVG